MKTLVLCSGGLKSTILTTLASKEAGELGLLYYQQKDDSRYAIASIRQLSHLYNARLHHLPLHIPHHSERYRLTMFLLCGITVAKNENYDALYYGTCLDNNDKSASMEYLKTMQHLLYTIGMNEDTITIEAPFQALTLTELIRYGYHKFEVPWHIARSCLDSHPGHCGQCAGCYERHASFREADCNDPTIYRRTADLYAQYRSQHKQLRLDMVARYHRNDATERDRLLQGVEFQSSVIDAPHC